MLTYWLCALCVKVPCRNFHFVTYVIQTNHVYITAKKKENREKCYFTSMPRSNASFIDTSTEKKMTERKKHHGMHVTYLYATLFMLYSKNKYIHIEIRIYMPSAWFHFASVFLVENGNMNAPRLNGFYKPYECFVQCIYSSSILSYDVLRNSSRTLAFNIWVNWWVMSTTHRHT